MSLMQFLSILRARWNVAAVILLTTLAAALAWVLLRPEHYTARTPVLVDIQAADVGGGWAPTLVTSYLATQMDIARSDRVAERVLASFKDAPTDMAGRRDRLRDLKDQLEVKPARDSNIINIAWTGDSAAEAARVANAFAQAYVYVALELKTNPAKHESTWFDEQVGSARQKLEQAQTKLSDFQQKAGIVSEQQADHEMARLTELSMQLAQVQAQTTDSQSKRGASRDTVAEVIQSPLINGLKADMARVEAQVQQASATLGPRHPQMLRLEGELAALRSRLASETGRIASSIDTTFQAGRNRETELQSALNAQRGRVLAVNKDRGQLALLRQDLQTAQRAYEEVSTGASKSRLQALTTQTNLRLLAPAVEPADPSGPSAKQALGIAAAAGLLLAIAGALLAELLNRRVRSIDDIAMATHLPVLATVPAASPFAALPAARGGRLALTYGRAQ
jgi:succinoglycan biosynthesis transport protein ExoP